MKEYQKIDDLEFRVGSLVYDQTVCINNIGGAARDCHSNTHALCRHSRICYARKVEKQYKAVTPFRRRQGHTWRHTDAKTFATALNWLYGKGIKHFRFNESGDFWNQEDVDKLNEVTEYTPMNIFGYTANWLLNYKNAKFKVKLSQMFNVEGTTGRSIAIPKGTKVPKGFFLCPKTSGKIKRCTDSCGLCFTDKMIDVAFFEH